MTTQPRRRPEWPLVAWVVAGGLLMSCTAATDNDPTASCTVRFHLDDPGSTGNGCHAPGEVGPGSGAGDSSTKRPDPGPPAPPKVDQEIGWGASDTYYGLPLWESGGHLAQIGAGRAPIQAVSAEPVWNGSAWSEWASPPTDAAPATSEPATSEPATSEPAWRRIAYHGHDADRGSGNRTERQSLPHGDAERRDDDHLW